MIAKINDVKDEVRIQPEVLFSLYKSKESTSNFLQFVFPGKITLEYQPQDPKFYTFMSTDSQGFNSFFHCFIFYDEINEAEIAHDFDTLTNILKKKSPNRKTTITPKGGQEVGSHEDEEGIGAMFRQQREKIKKVMMRRKQSTQCLYADDICKKLQSTYKRLKEGEETPKTPCRKNINAKLEQSQAMKQEMKKMMTTIKPVQQTQGYNKSWMKPTTNAIPQFAQNLKSFTQDNEQRNFCRSPERKNSDKDSLILSPPPLLESKSVSPDFRTKDQGDNFETPKQDDSYSFSKLHQKIQHTYYQQQQEQYFNSQKKVPQRKKKNEENLAAQSDEGESEYFISTNQSGLHNNRNSINEDQNEIEDLMAKKRYVPVAFCIDSATEHHDIFKQILIALYEMIRAPEDLMSRPYYNRIMAFAELISHIAFLKTLPAPPYNSIYNIHFLNQIFTIRETAFDQIPNKNQLSIKILFDCLDVKSILYCWKALLLDKSLVLVSSQYSLQFYVAEGLKQLLFPFTWQNSYIQPGNKDLLGYCEGVMTLIYTSHNLDTEFYDFEALLADKDSVAICDIDTSITNNVVLPQILNEHIYIRILSELKNKRIGQYDMAYPQQVHESDDFVESVRQLFFQILKPYIVDLDCYIKKPSLDNKSFYSYFKKQEYLSNFEDNEIQLKFAKELIESTQFVHFCDDSFEDEINNYHMLKAILCSSAQGACTRNDKSKNESGKIDWLETEPVIFNFRLPQNHHRVLLFEKLYYMNNDQLNRRKKDDTRQTNKDVVENIRFESFIDTIKRLYQVKSKGTHLKYQAQDQKIQNSFVRYNKEPSVSVRSKQARESYYLQVEELEAQKLNLFNADSFNYSNKHQHDVPQIQKVGNAAFRKMQNPRMQEQANKQQQNFQSVLLSNDGESMIYQEQIRVQNNTKRISKLIYGKKGLVSFLYHLFGLIDDKELKHINYYFAMREQIKQLEIISGDKSVLQSQLEDVIEEKESDGSHTNTKSGIHFAFIATPMNRNEDSISQSNTVSASRSHYIHGTEIFRNTNQWMSIDRWDYMGKSLKYTYQMILFKQKLNETFECAEDAYCKIFFDLIKFPPNKMQFFPKGQYMQIWESLSKCQRMQIFEKYGRNQSRPPVRMICQEFINDSSKRGFSINDTRSSTFSNQEDSLFGNANPDKSYAQKREEEKAVMEQLKVKSQNSSNSKIGNGKTAAQQSMQLDREKSQKQKDAGFEQVRGFLNKKKEAMKSQKTQKLSEPSTPKVQLTVGKMQSQTITCNPNFPDNDPKKLTFFKHVNSQLVVQNYDLSGHFKIEEQQLNILIEPDRKSQYLIKQMIQFWKTHCKHINNKGYFVESELSYIQGELQKLDSSFKVLKKSEPDFQDNDIIKQCFFLNIFNFLVLYRIACLMFSEPEILKTLTSFNRWYSFLMSCQIYIGGIKLDAYQILFSILRINLSKPSINDFMVEVIQHDNRDFEIKKPNQLLCFATFIPLKGFPHLQVYKASQFDEQIRQQAEMFLAKRIKMKEDHKLIILPKLIHWHLKDFIQPSNKQECLTLFELLTFLKTKVMLQCSQFQNVSEKILAQIKEKEGEREFIVDYKCFDWNFKPSRMSHYFEQINQFF